MTWNQKYPAGVHEDVIEFDKTLGYHSYIKNFKSHVLEKLTTEMLPSLYLKEILILQDLYFSVNGHSWPSSVDEDPEQQFWALEKQI